MATVAHRGECCICQRSFRLRKDGTVHGHYMPGTPLALECEGSRKPPRSACEAPQALASAPSAGDA